MRIVALIVFLSFTNIVFSQETSVKIARAVKALQEDRQFEHAVLSFYVVDSKTGKLVYAKNEDAGLAPASCQKIVTSASGYEILGGKFTYETKMILTPGKEQGTSNLHIIGDGDPSLGSWRWKSTSEALLLNDLLQSCKKFQAPPIKEIFFDESKWGTQTIPGGWPWEDIGQYYGAGSSAFNWHENQFNIVLMPGKKNGDSVFILSAGDFEPGKLVNELTTGPVGSGDQVYVYGSVYGNDIFLRGTVPLGVDSLTVAAAAADGQSLFRKRFWDAYHTFHKNSLNAQTGTNNLQEKITLRYKSPLYDSMNYWFMKKSINLYGEAFVKTMAYQKKGKGSTDSGLSVIREFWGQQGIDKGALKIIDGSGLSPANRVTTHALVTILQFAKSRPWFPSFYHALPEMNGMKMKDGYIGGVRSYAGYVKASSGAEYCFAFIVNNFDGAPSAARQKIWKLLDLLK